MEPIERIAAGDRPLALIIRREIDAAKTTFFTPEECAFQVGLVVYGAGREISRHRHRPLERRITGTSEVVLVRSGSCAIDIFDDDRTLVATRELRAGDLVLLTAGGHGFRTREDTVLLEIKQGPYTGLDEKELF